MSDPPTTTWEDDGYPLECRECSPATADWINLGHRPGFAPVRQPRPLCAVLQTTTLAPDALDGVLTRLAADEVPRLRSTPGLASFAALANRSGRMVTFSAWDSREAASSASAALEAWLRGNAPASPAEPVETLIGEVAAQIVGIGANDAVIWRWTVDPTRVEDALGALRSGFLPLIRAARGFCRCEVVLDRAGGRFAVIGGFDSPEAAARAGDLGTDWSEQNAGLLGNAPANVTTCAVQIRAVPANSPRRTSSWWPFPRRSS